MKSGSCELEHQHYYELKCQERIAHGAIQPLNEQLAGKQAVADEKKEPI
jgi:hypothetical protein